MALAGVITFPFMLVLALLSAAFSQVSLQSLRHADHSTKIGRSIRILAVSLSSCPKRSTSANYAPRRVPTSHFHTGHRSNLRLKPHYRSIPHIHPDSNALAIESEALEEDRSHHRTQFGCLYSRLRYYQECFPPSGEFQYI